MSGATDVAATTLGMCSGMRVGQGGAPGGRYEKVVCASVGTSEFECSCAPQCGQVVMMSGVSGNSAAHREHFIVTLPVWSLNWP
jgi:hypothetical protein